jgi:hypothetical protein
MKPRRGRICEGRANPKGISYLYVANNSATAIAESRPWVGAHVSIARLKIMRDLRIVTCISNHLRRAYLKEPDAPERERAVWKAIDRAFSEPVTTDDETADYAPTQLLAEFFRNHGLDGVSYRSSLGEGHNLALFDLDSARVVGCSVQEIRSVKYECTDDQEEYAMDTDDDGE